MLSNFDASFAAMIVFRPLRVDNEQNDLAVAEVITDLVDRRVKEVRIVAPSSTALRVMASLAALYTKDGVSRAPGIGILGRRSARMTARRVFEPPLLARDLMDLTIVVVAVLCIVRVHVEAMARERASLVLVVLVAFVDPVAAEASVEVWA